jgi:integrase/recombinase XerD
MILLCRPTAAECFPMIPSRPDPHRDPIGPFLHYLMAECGLSPNTLAAYRSDIVRFSRWRKQHSPGPLAELDIGILTG